MVLTIPIYLRAHKQSATKDIGLCVEAIGRLTHDTRRFRVTTDYEDQKRSDLEHLLQGAHHGPQGMQTYQLGESESFGSYLHSHWPPGDDSQEREK
jgi:hypothetical protein